MSTAQLIQEICRLNRTADARFLGRFDRDDLDRYLAHLKFKSDPDHARSAWVRPGDTPAMIRRERI